MNEYAEPYADESFQLGCKDLESGHEGQFIIDDDETRLRLVSFEGRQEGRDSSERTLKLENGKYAALFDCIPAGGIVYGFSESVTSRQDTIPNLTILGPRLWRPSDRVRQLRYTFVGAKNALFYFDHVKSEFKKNEESSYVDIDIVHWDKADVLVVETQCADVKLRMAIERAMGAPDPRITSTPTVIIEFRVAAEIKDALLFAQNVLEFFELSIGTKTRMRNVVISAMSEAEVREALAADVNKIEEFQVRRLYSEWRPSNEVTHRGDVLFPVYSDELRSSTKKSLARWVDRVSNWSAAYSLASHYVQESEVYGRDRLLRVMAWFEAIPDYQKSTGISSRSISEIARAAADCAIERKLNISYRRIKEVLSALSRASLGERVGRAILAIREKYGPIVVPPSVDEDCRAAVRFRNQAAHGSLNVDKEFETFYRSILAMELICTLAMVAGLDFEKSRYDTVYKHPLLQYRRERSRH